MVLENKKLQLLKNKNELIKARNLILQSQSCCKKNSRSFDYSFVECNRNIVENDDHNIDLYQNM